MKCFIFLGLLSMSSMASDKYGYLDEKDQKYYKNDSLEGNNQRERIDSTVKEINRLHGELQTMKSEIDFLKKEIEILKKGK